jgi:hypothetical protein
VVWGSGFNPLPTRFDLFAKALPNPLVIATLIDNGPNDHLIGVMGIVNSERENLANFPMIILENDPVRTSCNAEALDV